MMRPDDLSLSYYRYNATGNFALNIFLQFSSIIHNLNFHFGLVLISYLASLWLRQHMEFYTTAWNMTLAIVLGGGVMLVGLVLLNNNIHYHWLMPLEEVLWLTLLLAALPPSSGSKRRKIAEAAKKLLQRWATGIPIAS